jgi:hypothetical protein
VAVCVRAGRLWRPCFRASLAACGLLVELQARPTPCYGTCMIVLAESSEELEAVLSSTIATLVVSARSCMRHGGGWLLFRSHRVGGGRAPLQGPNGPTLPMLGHLDVVEELDLCFSTQTKSLAMTYIVLFVTCSSCFVLVCCFQSSNHVWLTVC